MTKAVFKQHDHVFRVQIDGHAGFNPGNDPVCAAASILAYTLLQVIQAEDEAGTLERFRADINDAAGTFHLRISAKHDYVDRIGIVVGTIAGGFSILAHKFPEHVTVEFYTPIH